MLAQLRDRRWSGMDRQFKAADIGALAKLIAELSAFATACRDLVQEIELNPVIVHRPGHGCTVADALMVVEPASSR